MSWPLPPEWDERQLEEAVSGAPRPMPNWRWTETPDFDASHQQLQTHRNLTCNVIDYAGDKIPIYDWQTGDVDFRAALFVAVLGASSYTFVEATRSEDLSCWIGSNIRALKFLGGVPELAIADNIKTGVHPRRHEPDLQFWFSVTTCLERNSR